jgi:hypothetical protein
MPINGRHIRTDLCDRMERFDLIENRALMPKIRIHQMEIAWKSETERRMNRLVIGFDGKSTFNC